MEIAIEETVITFSDLSKVRIEGYDLDIEEPEFDRSSEAILGNFINKRLGLPSTIDRMVRRTWLEPITKVYMDSDGRKRLYAYFD